MSDTEAVPSGGNDAPITVIESGATGDLTMNGAAKALADIREKRNQPAESADPATAEQELSDEGNAAPDENQAHGEDQEADPAAKPPIERPKSWTETEDAEWQATPRTLQEKIVARELERDTALRRSQNEAAEKLKGLTAKEQAAEQVKAQYESRLADQMQSLVEYNNSQFSAIKSQADVDFLANEAVRLANAGDFVQAQQYQAFLSAWQVHQQKMAGKRAELEQAEGQKAQKHQSEWAKFVQEESSAFADSTPEYKAKKADYDTKAAAILREIGFSDDELNKLASGEDKIPLFDRRVQRLLFDRIKLSEIQSAPKAVAKTPVPPVQRPGVSRPQGQAISERVQALDEKLTNSGSLDDAFRLRLAQVNAAKRRSNTG